MSGISAGLSRGQTFALAIVVIIGFLVFYYVALINACVIKSDTQGIELVTSTLGPIVASIIGYYFGQRPIQPIAEAAETAKSNLREFSSDTYQAITELQQTIAALRDENRIKDDLINNLKSQIGV